MKKSKQKQEQPIGFDLCSPFKYVPEYSNEYLNLWHHRWDYIWAPHANPGEKPNWRTESKHPLSDRLLLQGAYLFGIRPRKTIDHLVIDIDRYSQYHPSQDPQSIDLILQALEPIGIEKNLLVQSSYSQGIHIFVPLSQEVSSYLLADVTCTLLENAGFAIAPGALETFPNRKVYVADNKQSLFNAYRLPFQEPGSKLLSPLQYDPDTNRFKTIRTTDKTDIELFVEQWQWSQTKNITSDTILKNILKRYKRKPHFRLKGGATKYLNDLNADIEAGWTDYSQTNYLLGRITMRGYVFGHILENTEPLKGQCLVDYIIQTAKALPGFEQWCQHKQEIKKRATEWARCIETSPKYYHYGYSPDVLNQIPENQESQTKWQWQLDKQEQARQKIIDAIADLLNKDQLPSTATARCQEICAYGISMSTLYKHKDLWHPEHIEAKKDPEPPPEGTFRDFCLEPAPNEALQLLPDNLFRYFDANKLMCNSLPDAQSKQSATNPHLSNGESENIQEMEKAAERPKGFGLIRQVLQDIQSRQQEEKRQLELQPQKSAPELKLSRSRQSEKMRQFMASGDPILIAEAQTWLQSNPNQLTIDFPAPIPSNTSAPVETLSTRVVSVDLSDLLVEIDCLYELLAWSRDDERQYLYSHFGKHNRHYLEEEELHIYRDQLKLLIANPENLTINP
ncbi:hypothetical protein Pse7367_3770 (plasmid) [Thalassoporum mexicanum PCC 7367]|uniref:hypothetical protein n=1 Tax=Thalassoporum mexicanum TaxID=3457544 RepID=UPI00029FD9F3|nr:hypothetical protein [Pseudanabaena sp. PCC 7367]AFY71995.1 hypothetical protein Pse7367_3770 [Pseudanabaena sp. PCC 7367]